jgi:hypothetical protein
MGREMRVERMKREEDGLSFELILVRIGDILSWGGLDSRSEVRLN